MGVAVVAEGPPVGSRGPIFFDVTAYGAVGDGVHDDGAALVAAYAAARTAPGGAGCVLFPPGRYLTNQQLVGSYGSANPELAPSLVGFQSVGHIGDVAYPGDSSSVELVAGPSFPVGSFLVDYQQNATVGGPSGAVIEGITLECQGRAAGLRLQGPREFVVRQVTIINAAAPAGVTDGADGAFSVTHISGHITTGAWSHFEHITVVGATDNGIYHDAPNQDVFVGCHVLNSGVATASSNYYLNTSSQAVFIGCDSQGGYHGWNLIGFTGMIIGCGTESGATRGNFVVLQGGNSGTTGVQLATFFGCQLGQVPDAGFGEQDASVIVALHTVGRPQAARFDGCEVFGTANTKDWVYCQAGTTGYVDFENTGFHGTVTNLAYNDASGNGVLTFVNCRGINPAGTIVVAVPATGVATAPLAVPAVFYVKAAVGGSVTVTVQGGPGVVVAAGTLATFYVPAGQTVTPVFGAGNAPTWQVQGL